MMTAAQHTHFLSAHSVLFHVSAYTLRNLFPCDSEGRLPQQAHFEAEMLAEWWAEGLEFDKFLSG